MIMIMMVSYTDQRNDNNIADDKYYGNNFTIIKIIIAIKLIK